MSITNAVATTEVSDDTLRSISTPDRVDTRPGKGWFALLRLYSPLPPFFDRTWQPSEIDPSPQR